YFYFTWFGCEPIFNPKPNNLDRRFRIYRETLSRFSCAASAVLPANIYMARKELPLGDKQVPKWALYSRLPMQFVLIALVKKL
ncbi:hypothetical protein ACTMNS_04870, partial [Staphylococcus haemolyticus]